MRLYLVFFLYRNRVFLLIITFFIKFVIFVYNFLMILVENSEEIGKPLL